MASLLWAVRRFEPVQTGMLPRNSIVPGRRFCMYSRIDDLSRPEALGNRRGEGSNHQVFEPGGWQITGGKDECPGLNPFE